jgi:outer membrane receptor protein involved in Fe transport
MGKTRFEYVNYSLGKNYENGFLTYQEIKYVFVDKISLAGRIILFDTKSYNTRLYEFENDLRGVMTNLPMFGEGFRWYVLLKYKIINDLNLFIKYSETFKPNVESISSGNSEIIGNVDNRLSLQLDYSF